MKAKALALALSSLLLCSHAFADVIYQNGNLDGNNGGATISAPQAITDSFTVSNNAAALTDAIIGIELPAGSTPLSLTWSLGSSAFGSDLGSGTSTLTNTYQSTYNGGDYYGNGGPDVFFDVYLSSFALTSGTLLPGTYWLTLTDATSSTGDAVGWDINGGPSSAFYRFPGETGSTASEYFVLNGTLVDTTPPSTQVPEPASLAILGLGLAGLGVARRRKAA